MRGSFYLKLQQWWAKTHNEWVHPIPYWLGAPKNVIPPEGWVRQWVTDKCNRTFIVYRPYDPEDGKWT